MFNCICGQFWKVDSSRYSNTKSLTSIPFGAYYRSEGFPARDIWFLGTLEQGSARCPEFLGNRRRRRRRRRRLLEIQVDIQARKL